MEAIVELILKTYGIAGLIMISPAIAAVALWRHSVTVQTEHDKALAEVNKLRIEDAEKHAALLAAANDKVVKAQEQRVQDANSVRDKLVDLMTQQTAASQDVYTALDRVCDFLADHEDKQRALPPPSGG